VLFFFFQAEDGIRDFHVTGVQTCALPISKVEHDRLTLSYDKLQQLSQRLNLRMSDLFAEDEEDSTPRVTGRRSIAAIERAARVRSEERRVGKECGSGGSAEH